MTLDEYVDGQADKYNGTHEPIHNKDKFDIHNGFFRDLFMDTSSGSMDIDQMFERKGKVVIFEVKPLQPDNTVHLTWGQYLSFKTLANISNRQKMYMIVHENEGRNYDDYKYIGNFQHIRHTDNTKDYMNRTAVRFHTKEFYKTDFERLQNFIRETWKIFDNNIDISEILKPENWKLHESKTLTTAIH